MRKTPESEGRHACVTVAVEHVESDWFGFFCLQLGVI